MDELCERNVTKKILSLLGLEYAASFTDVSLSKVDEWERKNWIPTRYRVAIADMCERAKIGINRDEFLTREPGKS